MVEIRAIDIPIGAQTYPFHLCYQRMRCGTVDHDHYWLDARKIYGQRNRSTKELENLANMFWHLSELAGTQRERDVQETYLLARLSPYVRSTGARAIFEDSRLHSEKKANLHAMFGELDELLAGARTEIMSAYDFHTKTAMLCSPPSQHDGIQKNAMDLEGKLLSHACSLLASDAGGALKSVIMKWKREERRCAGRKKDSEEKITLDALSYDCRAAVHRCYSAAWYELIPRIQDQFGLAKPSRLFLRFWHTERIYDGRDSIPPVHLFHGHVFGLHPGCGWLLATKTGRELVADWLNEPSDTHTSCILNALFICLCHYQEKHAESNLIRRKRPTTLGDMDHIHWPGKG